MKAEKRVPCRKAAFAAEKTTSLWLHHFCITKRTKVARPRRKKNRAR